MAIYECKYRIGLSDVGASNTISNKAILKVLENAGGMHSETVGYGLSKIETTKLSWVLLNWKVKVLKRPIYNEELIVKTWASGSNKITTNRDFEVFNSRNELVIIATSKWTLINIETKSLAALDESIVAKYEPEEKTVFGNETIQRLKEPELCENVVECKASRADIDINEHVHNLCYLDYAYEALPENVYRSEECNNIEIMYKKQIRLNEKILCFYKKENEKNIIVIKSEDKKNLHAIINLY